MINFQLTGYENFRLGVPNRGIYQELLNSDQEIYGAGSKSTARAF
ncbi:alpha amylase C-terminal domain-containing protein [Desulfosporosinus metallidurans]|uniref:1,4-alpha-glucan (Glycogen) branching enzyme, GH-13-type n=1 Tax=Desulfosporosinus metallidurans TaxID=1888891 RepID=A0A1Q8QQ58_9FIRM|nr:alpha amylase C-terminal domain-containing protein [Desulfosporosinus metallidurans]OLN29388.1 1,4-alpha-glucan (glycogen) branching enzyme, GH-13-type [Desulfosporosinus metallidurans]